MKIVIVHHLNDAQHYLFGVPEESCRKCTAGRP